MRAAALGTSHARHATRTMHQVVSGIMLILSSHLHTAPEAGPVYSIWRSTWHVAVWSALCLIENKALSCFSKDVSCWPTFAACLVLSAFLSGRVCRGRSTRRMPFPMRPLGLPPSAGRHKQRWPSKEGAQTGVCCWRCSRHAAGAHRAPRRIQGPDDRLFID